MTQNFFNLNTENDKKIIESFENKKIIFLLKNLNYKLSYITGSSKSGKSTLVNNFGKIHNAKIIVNSSDLKFSTDDKIYFIDQNISHFDSELFFHFIQNVLTHDCFLYLFSEFDHNQQPTGLADLDSRLALFNKFNLEEPSTDLMIILLRKYLEMYSISINESIILELPKLIDRTYLAVYNCANDINRLLYQNNHNINLRLIKEFYNAI